MVCSHGTWAGTSSDFFSVWKSCLEVPRILPFTDIWRITHIRGILLWFLETFGKGRCLEIQNQAGCIWVSVKTKHDSPSAEFPVRQSGLVNFHFFPLGFSILLKLWLNLQLAPCCQLEHTLETGWKRRLLLTLILDRSVSWKFPDELYRFWTLYQQVRLHGDEIWCNQLLYFHS